MNFRSSNVLMAQPCLELDRLCFLMLNDVPIQGFEASPFTLH